MTLYAVAEAGGLAGAPAPARKCFSTFLSPFLVNIYNFSIILTFLK
jgi:hypothetical protein